MDFSEIGKIGDYVQTFCNKEAIITSDCWNAVTKKLTEKNKVSNLNVLRGMFENELPFMNEDPMTSTVNCLNYESQLRPIYLVTKRDRQSPKSAPNLFQTNRRKKLLIAT